MKLFLMKLSMFVALIALPVVVDAAGNGPAYMTKTGVSGTSDLPLDAQFAISGALGKQSSSYHAVEETGGYRLDNRRHALTASFLPTGVAIQTGSARWGLALNAYGYGSDLSAVPIVAPQAESTGSNTVAAR